ncbi:hypothetical protein IW261DRAFT_1577618 [Armillaria novae-zelandiae]|uniref:Uncharacterized protein n=1 Tax=Armillaria novae-zelandiae TaxID=153914 RepID=A0AA39KFQ4_9AGAR|nr:hypothetical protein IW261DRAFT_1577618 [Armillaria novae-zelandiae]
MTDCYLASTVSCYAFSTRNCSKTIYCCPGSEHSVYLALSTRNCPETNVSPSDHVPSAFDSGNCFETTYRRPATKGLKPFAYKSICLWSQCPPAMIYLCRFFQSARIEEPSLTLINHILGKLCTDRNLAEPLATYECCPSIPATRHSFPTLSTPEIAPRQRIACPGSMVNSTASEVLMIVVWKYVPTTDLFLQSELCQVVSMVMLLLLNLGTSISAADEDQGKGRIFEIRAVWPATNTQIGGNFTQGSKPATSLLMYQTDLGPEGMETRQQLARENFKCTALFEQTTGLIEGPEETKFWSRSRKGDSGFWE